MTGRLWRRGRGQVHTGSGCVVLHVVFNGRVRFTPQWVQKALVALSLKIENAD